MGTSPELLQIEKSLPSGLRREFELVEARTQDFIDHFLTAYLDKTSLAYDTHALVMDTELLAEVNRRGFFSLWIPRVFGGQGFHPLSMNIFNQLVGGKCLGTANIVGAHYFAFALLSLTQNFRLVNEVCRDIVRGERGQNPCCLAAAVTEPSAGTDREDFDLLKHAKVSSWARFEGDDLILNGGKIFISNAPWAQWLITLSTTAPQTPERGTVVLAIRRDTPGIEIGKAEKKLGQHPSPTSSVFFNNCRVKAPHIAFSEAQFADVEEHRELSRLSGIEILSLSRSSVGFMATGVALEAFRQAQKFVQYKKSENQEVTQSELMEIYNKYLQAQMVSWESSLATHRYGPYADMLRAPVYAFMKTMPAVVLNALVKILSSRKVMVQARKWQLKKKNFRLSERLLSASSVAKFTATDLAEEACLRAFRLVGMEAFSGSRNDLFRLLRDVKLLQIYEGTNETNRIQAYRSLTKSADFVPYGETWEGADLGN